MKDINQQFKGTWSLVEWAAESAEGEIVHPFGVDAVGQITYDATGNMTVFIMKKERAPFASEDPLQARPDEVIEAYDGFIAYCGTYDIDTASTRVIHRITFSSFPNWIGQQQVRNYEINGDQLILSTPRIGSFRHKFIWKRT